MPLTATVADRRIEAWTLSHQEWTQLKRDYRTLGCTMSCGERGHPKSSPLGTQYFAHLPKTDCRLHEGGPESPEHLRAKVLLAEAARAAGWTATVEFPAPDRSWIADVLIERGRIRMALEVQWSPQSTSDFERRQKRYAAAGVDGRWFVAERNRHNASTVPSFVISGSVDELLLNFPNIPFRPRRGPVHLGEGLQLLLEGYFKPRVEVKLVSTVIHAAMSKCWEPTCRKWITLWRVVALGVSTRCGEAFEYSLGSRYEEHRLERTEHALQGSVVHAIDKSDLPAAVRYDTRHDRVAGYHTAMVCPHCNVVFGDRYVNKWGRYWSHYTLPCSSRITVPPALLRMPHLCHDAGHGQCNPSITQRPDALLERTWAAHAVYEEAIDQLPIRRLRRRGTNS